MTNIVILYDTAASSKGFPGLQLRPKLFWLAIDFAGGVLVLASGIWCLQFVTFETQGA